MKRHSIALCLIAAAASGVLASANDWGGLFDGLAAPKVDIPSVKFTPSASAARTLGGPTKQSGADLYYFTPQEARQAAQRFKDRPQPLGWSFDSDVPADIRSQMTNDLAFMAGITGSGKVTPLHQQIFGDMGGQSYRAFFDSRVSAIGMNDCGSAKAVACVIPYEDPSKMWLTQNYVKFSHPQIARLMVVYHESRHTESQNGNWSHATCPTPFHDADDKEIKSIWTGSSLAGEPACDKTPLGSYGSSTILIKNIQKYCANCTDKVKMDAGLYSDDQLKRIIDAKARKKMDDDFKK